MEIRIKTSFDVDLTSFRRRNATVSVRSVSTKSHSSVVVEPVPGTRRPETRYILLPYGNPGNGRYV